MSKYTESKREAIEKRKDELLMNPTLDEQMNISRLAWFYGIGQRDCQLWGYVAWITATEFCFVSSSTFEEYIFAVSEYSFSYSWGKGCWYIQRKFPRRSRKLNRSS